MLKEKENYERELIEKYKKYQQREADSKDILIKSLARDNMRKIEEVYRKNFHSDIKSVI